MRLHEWWMQGEQFAPHGSSNERLTHTIRLRRGRQWVASNPRQGPASLTHSITAIPLPLDHTVREQAIHHTDTATPTAGALVAAIGLRGRPQCLPEVNVPSHRGPAAGRHPFLRRHAANTGLRELHFAPATGSPVRETGLSDEQKNEQPAEHAFIVRRRGARGKRGIQHGHGWPVYHTGRARRLISPLRKQGCFEPLLAGLRACPDAALSV